MALALVLVLEALEEVVEVGVEVAAQLQLLQLLYLPRLQRPELQGAPGDPQRSTILVLARKTLRMMHQPQAVAKRAAAAAAAVGQPAGAHGAQPDGQSKSPSRHT